MSGGSSSSSAQPPAEFYIGDEDQTQSDEPPKLLSLMDTRDLMTSSSTDSMPTFIQGRRIRKPTSDAKLDAAEAVHQAREMVASAALARKLPFAQRLEREEGEITSASEDDRSSADGCKLGGSPGLRRAPMDETLAALRAASRRESPKSNKFGGFHSPRTDASSKGSPQSQYQIASAELLDGIDLRLIWILAAIFGVFLLVRAILSGLVSRFRRLTP